MVKVKNITWLSKEILEAEVLISDGEFNLLCFAHPFKVQKGEQIKEIVDAFEVTQIMKLNTTSLKAVKLDSIFAYRIEGELIDKENGLVKLGDILIYIDERFIPGDIETGDYITFQCDRLDI